MAHWGKMINKGRKNRITNSFQLFAQMFWFCSVYTKCWRRLKMRRKTVSARWKSVLIVFTPAHTEFNDTIRIVSPLWFPSTLDTRIVGIVEHSIELTSKFEYLYAIINFLCEPTHFFLKLYLEIKKKLHWSMVIKRKRIHFYNYITVFKSTNSFIFCKY